MYKEKSFVLVFVALFLFVSVFPVQSQEKTGVITRTVRGVITDRSSGHPLPFVRIVLSDTPSIGSTSDETGHFELKNVPVGRHNIETNYLGYEQMFLREVRVTSGKEVFLEISLKENVRALEEVIIKPTIERELPLNKMALTGATMLRVEDASRYAGGFDDPARLVSSFAGVSPAISGNGISVHGNAPHLLQWRLEDVEIPNPNHFADLNTLGGGILSSLSSHVLGNSDFFNGAFPAEYNNAVSGVFDMKMRNGNNRNYENTFQVGVMGIDVASEGPLSKNSNASYIFNYRYSTTGLLNKIDPSMDLGGTLDYQDLNFKLNFPTRQAGIFSVWGTALIDKFYDQSDFEEDPEKRKYNADRSRSDSKQYMGAGGVSHRYYFRNDAVLKTTLAATFSKMEADQEVINTNEVFLPYMEMQNQYTNLVLTSSYNRKYSSRFTNQTGFTVSQMYYDMDLKISPFEGYQPETISRGKGNTQLIAAYTSSSFSFPKNIDLTAGMNTQFLTLNNHATIEPRLAIRWEGSSRSTFALAYGLHSRMEKLDVYFVQDEESGNTPLNKDLDFTKAGHATFSFHYKLSEDMILKIEPYFQHLYSVPVVAGGSWSVLNRKDFYVEDPLVNRGKGRNIGIDITLERYMKNGYYYMINGSLFDSKYSGGNGKWYNTRFNRRYITNVMGGKEWTIGKNKQNVLSANLKFTLQGGERYSPIDMQATLTHPDKQVQYDESKPFSRQYSPMFITNATVSYKINRKRVSHEFAVKALNLTGAKEHYGHEYNHKTGKIDEYTGVTSLNNISYKLEF